MFAECVVDEASELLGALAASAWDWMCSEAFSVGGSG